MDEDTILTGQKKNKVYKNLYKILSPTVCVCTK